MTHNDCQVIKELFETKFKALDDKFSTFDKRSDRIIESFNGKNKMTDDRITRECEKITEIDDRVREVEKVQAVRISNLTKVIAGFAIGATILAERIWSFIFS